MADATIRPCPHCAHDRCELHELQDEPEDAWVVWCEECGSRGPVDATPEIAVMKWSLRYGHEAPTHVLDEWKH